MKVIIAGSRDFSDYELLKQKCDHFLANQTEVEVVSGTARGTDRLGEKYASEKGYKLTKFPALWNEYGKSAGHIRNTHMALVQSNGAKGVRIITNERSPHIRLASCLLEQKLSGRYHTITLVVARKAMKLNWLKSGMANAIHTGTTARVTGEPVPET